jgi:stalled ribosome alternative rescue factor ArfA
VWYIITMKAQKTIKARVNKDGMMGSASREHSVKKGKGSFRRQKKHQKVLG